ncbi:MAG: hypothetical protein Q7T63_06300 [Burkholderiaceae bacterium]|nr:hypothetical protein [Burkholderiaceae bacterium]MDO9090953.1 hypothetical protein [Burkholderiaceae bacterium]
MAVQARPGTARRVPRAAAAILALAWLMTGCGSDIDAAQTIQTGGLLRDRASGAPVNATVRNLPSAQVAETSMPGLCKAPFRSGLLDGRVLCTVAGGNRLASSEWQAGRKHGTETLWFGQTGHLASRTEWHDGQRHGLQEHYDNSGALTASAQWEHGRLLSEQR